jgi:HSP20 family molecular chaperone IbpA
MNTENEALTNTPAPVTPRTTEGARAPRVRWFQPTVDVFERAEGLILLFDLPGVPPSDIEVSTEDNLLTVQGVRTDGERGWRRVLTLAPTFDSGKIEAKAEHGVLVLTLPKTEAAKPRRIEVK